LIPNALAINIGGAELGNIVVALRPVFEMIKTLIVTDLSRTVITFMLLFVIIANVLKTAINKTPLKESAGIISKSLGLIIIITIFFRARNMLDKFSWYIIIAGIVVLLFSLFSKIGGKLFSGKHGVHSDYDNTKEDEKRNKKEVKIEKEAEKLTNQQVNEQKKEVKTLEDLDDDQLEKYINALKQSQMARKKS
jgi:hypothetical protein